MQFITYLKANNTNRINSPLPAYHLARDQKFAKPDPGSWRKPICTLPPRGRKAELQRQSVRGKVFTLKLLDHFPPFLLSRDFTRLPRSLRRVLQRETAKGPTVKSSAWFLNFWRSFQLVYNEVIGEA